MGFLLAGMQQFVWRTEAIRINREKLTRIYDRLEPGQDEATAAKAIMSAIDNQTVHTTRNEGRSTWYVSAPSEFLQTHWIMVVCIENGAVSGVRFGTGDSVRMSPLEGPATKGMCPS